MTDERFWRIVDAHESAPEKAMQEIVYYNKGDLGKSVSDYSLLIKSEYGGKENYLKVVDQFKDLCKEYEELGHTNFRKNYKNVFTS